MWMTNISRSVVWLSECLCCSFYLIEVMSGLQLNTPGLETSVTHLYSVTLPPFCDVPVNSCDTKCVSLSHLYRWCQGSELGGRYSGHWFCAWHRLVAGTYSCRYAQFGTLRCRNLATLITCCVPYPTCSIDGENVDSRKFCVL